jgi:hypothetical protein
VNIKASEINSEQYQSFPGWTRLLLRRAWCIWLTWESSAATV